MDLKTPGTNGVQATRRIRDEYPRTRVLILTTYDTDEWVFDAIRDTAAGKTPVAHAIAGKLLAHVARQAPVPTALGANLTDRSPPSLSATT